MNKIVLNVSGMSCSHCEKAVKKAITALNGVKNVSVDLDGGTVTVEYDEASVSLEDINAEIVEVGYEVN